MTRKIILHSIFIVFLLNSICFSQDSSTPPSQKSTKPNEAPLQPIIGILLGGGPQITKTTDAYGNVIKIEVRESLGEESVETLLVKSSDGSVEVKSDISSTDGKKITLEFIASDPSILNNATKRDLQIALKNESQGYIIDIPKRLMNSWSLSGVNVNSYGNAIPAGAVTVLMDDPRILWNSTLMPNADYVVPINISTGETGNKSIQITNGPGYFNRFYTDTQRLAYQVKYHVNYSAINSDSRTIKVFTGMSEDDLFGNDILQRYNHSVPKTITVGDISDHTSGVDYFIGANGWYAQDSKTGEIFAGENTTDIGFFEFVWDPLSALNTVYKSDAEFFADITIQDGSLEEIFNGDTLKFNKKIPWRNSSIKILQPSTGAQLYSGDTQTIIWETYYWDGDHEISIYYGDSAVTWESHTLVSRVQYSASAERDSGVYSWVVPDDPGDWELTLVRLNESSVTYMPPQTNTAITINEAIIYDTVISAGRTWLDRNIGASRVATNHADSAAYGDLYQWGRGTDGHEKRASGTTSNLSSSNSPGHSNFILSPSSPNDWRTSKNNDFWQGGSGINNPCPEGFRLPTITEWQTEEQSWTSHDQYGAYNSSLQLPFSGTRSSHDGGIDTITYSLYWSSSVNGDSARVLMFYENGSTTTGSGVRAIGAAVRCIKDEVIITVPTVTSAGQVWMDRNLGASRVATSSSDLHAYGDLYQWGRATDGHEKRTSLTINSSSTEDIPGHDRFIIWAGYPYDWRTPQNNFLWQGASGTNNPCPTGFRLPTVLELEIERNSWVNNGSSGAFGSPLKLVQGGERRNSDDGTIWSAGGIGYYWSSTVHSVAVRTLEFSPSNDSIGIGYRHDGNSIRCIKD